MQYARLLNLTMLFSLFLGVHLHNRYGSSYLVEKLSQFGFCKGYHEILQHEKRELSINENQTAEFAADNVDDDPVNVDGRDTIHIRGMIVALSPVQSNDRSLIPQNIVSNAQLSKLSSNLTFNFTREGAKQLAGLKYKGCMILAVCDKYGTLDCLWKCSQLSPNHYPLWSEFMQSVFRESNTVRNNKTVFLPFNYLSPNELNCVYSALKFISETATRNGKLPVCMFYQALWWKALLVTVSPNCDLGAIVIRLGGFHTITSFLGCIGYLMIGTGICEAPIPQICDIKCDILNKVENTRSEKKKDSQQ